MNVPPKPRRPEISQIEFDDEERHREGEDAVGQGIEPALRNKLPWARPSSSPVSRAVEEQFGDTPCEVSRAKRRRRGPGRD